MKAHDNSISAFYEGSRTWSKRTLDIIESIKTYGQGTDRQIQERLGLPERNGVAPRITEAIQAGLLREVGAVKCHITGKIVRVVDLPLPEPKQLFLAIA